MFEITSKSHIDWTLLSPLLIGGSLWAILALWVLISSKHQPDGGYPVYVLMALAGIGMVVGGVRMLLIKNKQ